MTDEKTPDPAAPAPNSAAPALAKPLAPALAKPLAPALAKPLAKEIGGAPGPEPTRYGDWQHKGRVTDF